MKPILLILMAGMVQTVFPRTQLSVPLAAGDPVIRIVMHENTPHLNGGDLLWIDQEMVVVVNYLFTDSTGKVQWVEAARGANKTKIVAHPKGANIWIDHRDAFAVKQERLDRPCAPETALTCDVVQKTEKEWPKTPVIAK